MCAVPIESGVIDFVSIEKLSEYFVTGREECYRRCLLVDNILLDLSFGQHAIWFVMWTYVRLVPRM